MSVLEKRCYGGWKNHVEMTFSLKQLFVRGFPGLYGGTGMEQHHRIALWRKMGMDVHLIPAWDCLREQQMVLPLYECDAFGYNNRPELTQNYQGFVSLPQNT